MDTETTTTATETPAVPPPAPEPAKAPITAAEVIDSDGDEGTASTAGTPTDEEDLALAVKAYEDAAKRNASRYEVPTDPAKEAKQEAKPEVEKPAEEVKADAPTDPAPAATEEEDPKVKERRERRERLDKLADQTDLEARQAMNASEEKRKRRALEEKARVDAEKVRQAEEFSANFKNKQWLLERFRESGVTAKELADQIAREGSPEAVLQQIKAEALAEVEKKYAEKEAERTQQETARAQQNAMRSFLSSVSSAKDDKGEAMYPAITSLYTPAQLAVETEALIKRALKNGYQPDDTDIANYLEEQAKPRYRDLQARFGKNSPQASSNGTAHKPTAANSTPAARAPAVTNQASSPQGFPANFDDMSDEEQFKLMTARVEKTSRR